MLARLGAARGEEAVAAQVGGDAPAIVLFDNQARLDGALATTYVDTATRAATPAMLAQMGNLSIPWMPDRGDLTIHRLEIVRDGKTIDLIAAGQKFTVLRREQQMEQNVLTGALTATLSVEGLQVGDVLRSSFSISQSDKALGARAMIVAMTPAAPFRAGFARSRLVWPRAQAAKWRGYAAGLATTERDVGDLHEVTVALPLPKAPDMPEDLPDRLRRLPIVEATNFADWADVSRTLAPLYATDGLIAPGSPLDREVAAIAAAESDPLRRAQRALELVQGKVRYLAVGMNGGALTPQPPARTWELRYGDCKAKTLLLLAMLHRLGVEAEPAVASVQMGAIVATRLPSAAAFDHILVRATIGGETLWLDGTGLGSRLEDIRDVPPLRHVLPLRTAGAVLEALPLRADPRPDRIVEVKWDQRAGVEYEVVIPLARGLELEHGPGDLLERLVGREVALGERPRRREVVDHHAVGRRDDAQDRLPLRRIYLPGEVRHDDLARLLVDEFDVDGGGGAPSIGRRSRHREAVMARAEPGA